MTTSDAWSETVSVIIPTHNRARLLPRAIRSVLAQSHRDLEVIVVDDASTDDTRRVVARLDDPRVRYISHDTNRGGAAARNTGIAAARGAYIGFQDSDDEWLLEKLEKQMRVFRDHGGDADIVYCGLLRAQCGSVVYIPESRIEVRQGDLLSQLLLGNFVSTQTLLVRRERIEDEGGFDERLGRFQDWELAIRLAAKFKFSLVDEPLVIVHETPGNITSNDAAGAAALELILDKHSSAFALNPTALAGHLAGLGHLKCLSGAVREGRGHLLDAVKLRPLAWKAWAALLLALLGSRAYRSSVTAVRRGAHATASE